MNTKSINDSSPSSEDEADLVRAVASLLGGDWQITEDRYTKDRAEDHAYTLSTCDCPSIAVRTFQ
jgi:hypothetical protein